MLDAKVHVHHLKTIKAIWNDTKDLRADMKGVLAMAWMNETTAEKTLQSSVTALKVTTVRLVSTLTQTWLQMFVSRLAHYKTYNAITSVCAKKWMTCVSALSLSHTWLTRIN